MQSKKVLNLRAEKIYRTTMLNKSIVTISFVLLLLTSCVSKKNILYFQDSDKYPSVDITQLETKIQPNDILSITVSSLVPETAIPYNVQTGIGTTMSPSPETMKIQGYLVSPKGTIEMPVLGTIMVKSKTINQLVEELKKILEDGGHLTKPTVNIRILNSKVTILGEVNNPGTYPFSEQYISLPQALGFAGDLNMNGLRKDVLLIRETDGVRTITHIDLTTANWMNDPKFSIKQNDVIIVNPNNKKIQSGGWNLSDLSTILGITSLLVSFIILFKK